MSPLTQTLTNIYKFLFHDLADKRSCDYFMVDNPFKPLTIIFLYLYFVKCLGPRFMENRRAFNLRYVMIAYNILQIVLNAFLFVEGYRVKWGWGRQCNYLCEPMDYSTTPGAIYITKLVHTYYMLKIIDLLDTIFMILKKKNNHITFLHVYHHAGMVALVWGATKYYPGGHGTFVGFINSFVHTVMYSYYLYALIWLPSKHGQVWWKKYVTLLQMVQFALCGVHQFLPVIVPNCSYTKIGAILCVPQTIFFIVLFSDFYIKTYQSGKEVPDTDKNIIKTQ